MASLAAVDGEVFAEVQAGSGCIGKKLNNVAIGGSGNSLVKCCIGRAADLGYGRCQGGGFGRGLRGCGFSGGRPVARIGPSLACGAVFGASVIGCRSGIFAGSGAIRLLLGNWLLLAALIVYPA